MSEPFQIETGVKVPLPRRRGRAERFRLLWMGMKENASFLVTDKRDMFSFRKLACAENWNYLTRVVREGDERIGWRVWKL